MNLLEKGNLLFYALLREIHTGLALQIGRLYETKLLSLTLHDRAIRSLPVLLRQSALRMASLFLGTRSYLICLPRCRILLAIQG